MRQLIITILLCFIQFNTLKAQSNDSLKVLIIGEFSKPTKYTFAYNDSIIRFETNEGVFGQCFVFKLNELDKKTGYLSIDLGKKKTFGKSYVSEGLTVQLFEKRILVLFNDKIIKNEAYFNAYWVDSLDPQMLIPEVYGILKKLKGKCRIN